MVDQFIFIEEGSLDTNNMLKLLQNSGLTETNIIRYKKGCPKPELVSVENEEQISEVEIMKKTIETHRTVVLNALAKFVNENTEKVVHYNDMRLSDVYRMIFDGTTDDFIDKFREFLMYECNE